MPISTQKTNDSSGPRNFKLLMAIKSVTLHFFRDVISVRGDDVKRIEITADFWLRDYEIMINT